MDLLLNYYWCQLNIMSAIIYALTVLYFSYVIYVVLGDSIGSFIKKNNLSGSSK
jgi:hypothetical protein